ncbi:hypothetical protein CAT723_04800 [Corynebacterium ammoniagenes]|uniref:Glycosyl transferase family 1 domain-containing protein n=2 Tax=Corynebacterium ammoniagenes TaxID=1697 RepID=A0AAV5G920_CORAM|nr:hypothetical protein CAT723_04800 [Corynebacterium ammoniagenes]
MISNSKAENLIRKSLNPWLRSVYGGAAAVIGIAPTMVQTLIARGTDKKETTLIYNWGDDSVPSRTIDKSSDVTEILFAGNIGDMQDLDTVVRAAHLVEDLPIIVTIVGDGVSREKIQTLAEELGCENVVFRGGVPKSEMPAIYGSAHFSLVTLRDLKLFRGTIPSKFQASIAHGVPVITTVQGDLRRLVEDFDLGFTSEGEDVESLAHAMRKAHELGSTDYEELQQRTRETYLNHFSRRAGIDAVETVLAQAVATTKGKDN